MKFIYLKLLVYDFILTLKLNGNACKSTCTMSHSHFHFQVSDELKMKQEILFMACPVVFVVAVGPNSKVYGCNVVIIRIVLQTNKQN